MIAVFVYTLEASNCTLQVHVYRERGSVVNCIRLIKGVSYVIKLVRLIDEYVLNSEVRLTSGLYSICQSVGEVELLTSVSL